MTKNSVCLFHFILFLNMSDLKKSLVIESINTTEDRDNVGESLDINGADISHLKNGFLNEDHARGFNSLLGRVIDAKKIHKESDCETPYQHKQWQKLKRPFIWTKSELWDGFGHEKADAVAAIYRYYQDRGLEPPIKTSVEGKVLERNGKRLTRTLVKGIALTVVPCNPHTHTEVVDVLKSQHASEETIQQLVKSDNTGLIFREVSDASIERIHALANLALEMIRAAKK